MTPNPTREPNLCRYCRAKLDRGLEAIGLEASRVHRLQLEEHFPRAMELPGFESLRQLMEYRYGEVDGGAAVASSLVSRLRDPDPAVAELADEIEESVRTAIALYEATHQAMKRLQPDLFVVFNGRFASVRPGPAGGQDAGDSLSRPREGRQQGAFRLGGGDHPPRHRAREAGYP